MGNSTGDFWQQSATPSRSVLIHRVNHRQEKINLQLCVGRPFQIVSDALERRLGVPEGKEPLERVVLGMID
jgi:hypothetical protein